MSIVLISIIIPLFNKEAIIKETINSVLLQTYTDYEFIIVDDGSTDKSVDIVKSIKDSRINIIQKENGGVSSARNYGAKIAKGSFLFFLDADDQITSDCLALLVNLSNDYPQAQIVTANHVNVNSDGKKIPFCLKRNRGIIKNPMKLFFQGDFMPRTGTTLFLRDIFFEVGGFDERISIYEDLDLDLKLLRNCIYAYTPEIVYIHRLDFAELSIKPQPIKKYFSFYILLDNQSFWEKLVLISCIMATYYKFKDFKEQKICDFLQMKLRGNKSMYIVFRLYSKYSKYRRRFLTNKI